MTTYTPLLIILLLAIASCNDQNQSIAKESTHFLPGDTVAEIGTDIRSIFQDSENNYWFATNGEGVFRYDGKNITQYTKKNGLCNDYVWYIMENEDRSMWFKTQNPICYFTGKEFFTTQPVKSNERSQVNYIDDTFFIDDQLLMEYYDDGLSLIKIVLPETSPLKNETNAPNHYDVYCTFRDSKDNIWFGTGGAGVCKFDGENYTWLDDKELGLAVRCIYEDSKGNIWIGNNGYGLFRYDGNTLTNFTREKKLDNPSFRTNMETREGTMSRVWTIAEDSNGNLWVGTIDNGVWMYDGKNFTNYTTKDGLGIDFIWTIYKDKKDKLWFGTDGAGVYIFDGQKFSKFRGSK